MSSAIEIREIRSAAGVKLGESEYIGGKLNGVCLLWEEDGTLALEATCLNRKYHGPYKSWECLIKSKV